MRRIVVSLASVVLFAGLAQAAPNFSGTWILDKDKSDSIRGKDHKSEAAAATDAKATEDKPATAEDKSKASDDKTKATDDKAAAGEDKSKAAEGEDEGEDVDLKLVVEQTETSLKATRSFSSANGDRSNTVTVDLSGKEVAEDGPRGGKLTSKSKWDGDKLIITTSRTRKARDKEVTLETNQTWSLSEDGKTLTIETERKGPRGNPKTRKSIFHKVEETK